MSPVSRLPQLRNLCPSPHAHSTSGQSMPALRIFQNPPRAEACRGWAGHRLVRCWSLPEHLKELGSPEGPSPRDPRPHTPVQGPGCPKESTALVFRGSATSQKKSNLFVITLCGFFRAALVPTMCSVRICFLHPLASINLQLSQGPALLHLLTFTISTKGKGHSDRRGHRKLCSQEGFPSEFLNKKEWAKWGPAWTCFSAFTNRMFLLAPCCLKIGPGIYC